MQRARRHDPYPATWELPVAALVAVALLLVVGLHVGRGVANLLAEGWWAFPDRRQLLTSVPGLLGGDALAGLNLAGRQRAPEPLLRACIATVEVIVLALIGTGLKVALDVWGPSRIRGVANRAETERLLGRSRLRRHAAVVRPDLHGNSRRRR